MPNDETPNPGTILEPLSDADQTPAVSAEGQTSIYKAYSSFRKIGEDLIIPTLKTLNKDENYPIPEDKCALWSAIKNQIRAQKVVDLQAIYLTIPYQGSYTRKDFLDVVNSYGLLEQQSWVNKTIQLEIKKAQDKSQPEIAPVETSKVETSRKPSSNSSAE